MSHSIHIVNHTKNGMPARLQALQTQLEWMKPGIDAGHIQVTVWNQDAPQDWCSQFGYVKWVHTTPKHLGPARTEILREFFNSDEDWISIWDNDLTVYDTSYEKHLDGVHFFKSINEVCELANGKIATFAINNPASVDGCQAQYRANGVWTDIVNENWCFIPCIRFGGIHWYNNIKKHFNKEFYQDWNLVHEDWAHRTQYIDGGLPVARLCNFFLKDLTGTDNSVIFDNNEQRKAEYKDADVYFANHVFPQYKKNGTMDWASLKRLNKQNKVFSSQSSTLGPSLVLKKSSEFVLQEHKNQVFSSLFG